MNLLHDACGSEVELLEISPVIANMALDGLEKLLASHFPKRRKDSIHTKVNLVRYADDVRHVTQGEILLTEKGGSEEDDLRVTALT